MQAMKTMGWMRGLAWGTLAGMTVMAGAQSFSADEITRVQKFWNSPGRLESKMPEGLSGPHQVRLTTQGSLWLWALDRKRGAAKGQTPAPNPEWDAYISAKIAYDRWSAQTAANNLNRMAGYAEVDPGAMPATPGPIPEDLYFMVGEAPTMAAAVQPKAHRIDFGSGENYLLQDNPGLAQTNRYYRYAQGVRHFGTQVKKLPASQVDRLFDKAGISDSERRIFGAVSLLEGGFDSVNTYDTGFVSVGFIQFACLSKGSGSLGAVMADYKSADRRGFDQDFRRFGLDVDSGSLVAIKLGTGETVKGLDAALAIINDPRYAAVFHRAGQKSDGWRVAQLRVAKAQYFPADDSVNVALGGKEVSLHVGRFIRSEAGLATLMDRKVHTGSLGNLANAAAEVADRFGLDSVDQLASYEVEVIKQLRHRKSFLDDSGLSQPATIRAQKSSKSRKAKS